MKDFLENLEIGENKVKLSQEEIKSILAEHGKSVKTETEKVENNMKKENEDLKATIDDLKEQISKAPKSDEIESLKSKIADYETKEKERKEEEDKKIFEENLNKNNEIKYYVTGCYDSGCDWEEIEIECFMELKEFCELMIK